MANIPYAGKYRERAMKLRLKGLTYREIGNHLGISFTTIASWLKGMPAGKKERHPT